jgi:hypothetical protein
MTMVSPTEERSALEGRMEDAQGRLHADGTSTCLIVSRRP